MTLNEFYIIAGGDYEEVAARMAGEKRIRSLLSKFSENSTFATLTDELVHENWEAAFHSAYAMKGACATLGLGNLCKASALLAEELHSGNNSKYTRVLYERVAFEYETVLKAIRDISA